MRAAAEGTKDLHATGSRWGHPALQANRPEPLSPRWLDQASLAHLTRLPVCSRDQSLSTRRACGLACPLGGGSSRLSGASAAAAQQTTGTTICPRDSTVRPPTWRKLERGRILPRGLGAVRVDVLFWPTPRKDHQIRLKRRVADTASGVVGKSVHDCLVTLSHKIRYRFCVICTFCGTRRRHHLTV